MNVRKYHFLPTQSMQHRLFYATLAAVMLLGVAVSPIFAAENHRISTTPTQQEAILSPDAQIAKRSAETLLWDQSVNLLDVNLIVSDGAVSLKGTVDSFYEKERAEELVEHVQGVTRVINNLEVRSAQARTDEQSQVRQDRGE
jgi:hypothetical protein